MAARQARPVLYLLAFIASFGATYAGILDFASQAVPPFTWEKEKAYRALSGMYAPQDWVGDDNLSYLQLNVTFQGSAFFKKNETISIVVFHIDELGHVGLEYTPNGTTKVKKSLCCTREMVSRQLCSAENTAIVPPDSSLSRSQVVPLLNGSSVAYNQRFDINVTGMYYLFILNCNGADTPDILMTGHAAWLNPFGYLPGEDYPFLLFYGILCLFYILLFIAWSVLSVRHCGKLLKLQYCIMVVILMGIIECTCWYFDYLDFNLSGYHALAALIVGVLVSTVKRTVSRLLVLVVAMGYGVVKPTLGTTRHKIIALGVIYFLVSATLTLTESIQKYQRVSGINWALVLFLVFPVALLDTLFYWWIFLSLLRTINQLAARRQTVKHQMYKRLLAMLVVSMVVTIVIVLWQLITNITSVPQWQALWVEPAFWHVLYYMVLFTIALLWRPTSNNIRYAYELVFDDQEDANATPMVAAGSAQLRAVGDSEGTDAANAAAAAAAAASSQVPKKSGFDVAMQIAVDDDQEPQAKMD